MTFWPAMLFSCFVGFVAAVVIVPLFVVDMNRPQADDKDDGDDGEPFFPWEPSEPEGDYLIWDPETLSWVPENTLVGLS
jgi:hypothetical protein